MSAKRGDELRHALVAAARADVRMSGSGKQLHVVPVARDAAQREQAEGRPRQPGFAVSLPEMLPPIVQRSATSMNV